MATERAADGARPVVMVHGLGVSSRYLLPTARVLAAHFPTFVPDLPGFGRTGNPGSALDVPDLADALVGWLDACGIEGPVLLGDSLGCQVIVDLAVRYPGRLSHAVLVGPTGDPAAGGLLSMSGRLLRDLPREPASLLLLQAPDVLRAGPRRCWRTARAMLRDPVAAKLPLVAVPTLVVRGERDPIAPQRWAEEAVALLPRGELAVVLGAAHGVNYSEPDALVAAVRAFLADDRPPAAG